MRRLTPEEFMRCYPRPEPSEHILGRGDDMLVVDGDTFVDGIVAALIVRSGRAIITGLVQSSLRVESGAVAYVDGLVEGTVRVNGALFVGGHVAGSIGGTGDVHDPTGPADSETRPAVVR